MDRIISFLLVVITASLLAACSTTSKSVESPVGSGDKSQQEMQSTPAWFTKESVSYDTDSISAFGTAIGSDSSTTVSKAEKRAELLLQQSVSDKLEELRSEAVKELGSDAGLDDPGFLIALRKADNAVADIVSTAQAGIEGVQDQQSVRGFAEVSVSKEKLIERIDQRLAAHEKAWANLKSSASFKKF